MSVPSYQGLKPSSPAASRVGAANRKTGSRCEQVLRSLLWRRGYRFRKNLGSLPGRPDIVFTRQKLVVFCDGDFWHGRHWDERQRKLRKGHNPAYWVAKVQANRDRDRRHDRELGRQGWTVLRLWETDILKHPERSAAKVEAALADCSRPRRGSRAPV